MRQSIEAVTKAASLLMALAQMESPSIPAKIGNYGLNATGGKKPRIEISNHPSVHVLEMGEVNGKPVVTVLVPNLIIPRECFGNSIVSFASLSGGIPIAANEDLGIFPYRSPDKEMDRVVAGEQREATVDQIHIDTKSTGGYVIVGHNTKKGFKVRGQGPNILIEPAKGSEHLRLAPTTPDSLIELLQLHERAKANKHYTAFAKG